MNTKIEFITKSGVESLIEAIMYSVGALLKMVFMKSVNKLNCRFKRG